MHRSYSLKPVLFYLFSCSSIGIQYCSHYLTVEQFLWRISDLLCAGIYGQKSGSGYQRCGHVRYLSLFDSYDVDARTETEAGSFLKILAEVARGIPTHFVKQKETPRKGCYYNILY